MAVYILAGLLVIAVVIIWNTISAYLKIESSLISANNNCEGYNETIELRDYEISNLQEKIKKINKDNETILCKLWSKREHNDCVACKMNEIIIDSILGENVNAEQ